MKTFLSFFLSIIITHSVFAQSTFIVSGKIIDADSKLPMTLASVFAENTTIGTATDAAGNFKLYLPHGGYNLVVTYTGYNTEIKRISTAGDNDNNIVIEIKQQQKDMADVVVKASYEVKDGWEKYGKFFLDHFIGKTANSSQCILKNSDALQFFFYKRKNLLKVLATAPLEIENLALGYTVKYTLDSFVHEYNTDISLYSGYPFFEEMESSQMDQLVKWNAARKLAYQGSILHFMRSLYQKKLQEEGFEIQFIIKKGNKEKAFPLKDFYSALNYRLDDSSNRVDMLPNQKEVAVIFKNEEPSKLYLDSNQDASSKFQLSVLTFLPNESLNIEQNGYYYEQNDITITGYWAWEKAGDMLPYDFKEKSTAPITNAVKPINQVSEKTEIITEIAKAVSEQPLIITEQDNIISDGLLTAVTWKMEESRVIDGNKMYYYKRDGPENTINFDNDLYQFKANNTGIYFYNGQEYKFNWKYLDSEKIKMEMVILYPIPFIVNLENISLSSSSLKYTRLQKVNGLNYVAIETRTVK